MVRLAEGCESDLTIAAEYTLLGNDIVLCPRRFLELDTTPVPFQILINRPSFDMREKLVQGRFHGTLALSTLQPNLIIETCSLIFLDHALQLFDRSLLNQHLSASDALNRGYYVAVAGRFPNHSHLFLPIVQVQCRSYKLTDVLGADFGVAISRTHYCVLPNFYITCPPQILLLLLFIVQVSPPASPLLTLLHHSQCHTEPFSPHPIHFRCHLAFPLIPSPS